MSNSSSSSSTGIGFFGVLAVAFIVLKLVGFITWSWWWVLSPIWMPVVFWVVIVLGVVGLFKFLTRR